MATIKQGIKYSHSCGTPNSCSFRRRISNITAQHPIPCCTILEINLLCNSFSTYEICKKSSKIVSPNKINTTAISNILPIFFFLLSFNILYLPLIVYLLYHTSTPFATTYPIFLTIHETLFVKHIISTFYKGNSSPIH